MQLELARDEINLLCEALVSLASKHERAGHMKLCKATLDLLAKITTAVLEDDPPPRAA